MCRAGEIISWGGKLKWLSVITFCQLSPSLPCQSKIILFKAKLFLSKRNWFRKTRAGGIQLHQLGRLLAIIIIIWFIIMIKLVIIILLIIIRMLLIVININEFKDFIKTRWLLLQLSHLGSVVAKISLWWWRRWGWGWGQSWSFVFKSVWGIDFPTQCLVINWSKRFNFTWSTWPTTIVQWRWWLLKWWQT